ncbi:MAG TPA: hypothetical protein VK508_22555 [Cyclobacteriaceae bacterium]|nr:hypothetical protein [Cyclobacteriaceae bacterium]
MELRDILVTPFVVLLLYLVAYFLRPRLTNDETRSYFFLALTLKILGALAVGFLYQNYYSGGDTYNYHTHGSRIIWEVFMDDPLKGMSMIFSPYGHGLYKYTSRIVFFTDPASFFVVRVAALFDLVTFSAYSATAVLFAFVSFLGSWFMFRAFYELFPESKKKIAACIFFVPSVIFWGSGLLKDTLVIACLGFATYGIKRIFIDKRRSLLAIVMLIISLFVIFQVKKYVLLCFLPAAIFWVYGDNLQRVQSTMLRLMLTPLIIIITVASGLFVVVKVGENDPKYAIDRLASTAKVTAYDIGFYTGKNAGSGYSLGELDGSFQGMLKLLPQAVTVSLFRPYLWESKNALMLFSSIEASALLIITLIILFRRPMRFIAALKIPTVVFCLLFSLTFAFAVGVSTYNFGTLTRYRIPMLPFYLLALVVIADGANRERKIEELEMTE